MSEPDLRIVFNELPSINDYLGSARHFGAAAGLIKKWRQKGFEQLIKQAEKQGFEITRYSLFMPREIKCEKLAQPIFTHCDLIVRYWRPTARRYDVFSPFIKPVVDGFVDAGLIKDDDQTHIRSVQVIFEGIDPGLKLSKEAQDTRKTKRKFQKKALLTPSRFWFDFHTIAP